MVIIFNKDGSIFDTNLSEYVMQGSNNVNNINVAFVDNTYENWSASFNFVLPNEDKHTLVGVSKQFLYKGVMYNGWSVSLTNNETLYNGTLKTTISLLQDNQTLYTYVFNITINETGYPIDGEWNDTINIAQYNNLLAQLATKFGIGMTSLVVDRLPLQGSINTIYYFKNTTSTPNYYNIIVWNGSSYITLGKTYEINYDTFVNKDYLNEILSNYVTTQALSTTLQDYVTNSYLTETLKGFATKSYVKTELGKYVTKNALDNTLQDYITSSALDDILVNYIDNDALNTTLENYVTNTSLTTTLSNYVTNTSLTTTLKDYITQEYLGEQLTNLQETIPDDLSYGNGVLHIVRGNSRIGQGASVKTINNQEVFGSGNISVQEVLQSGTNIKTVNNQSLLGSGNIDIEGSSEIPTITLTAGPGVGETLSEEDYQTILDNDIIHVVITFEGNKLDFVLNKVSMYLGDDGLLFVVFIINMPKVNANFNSSYLGIVIIEALTKKATWNLKTTFIFNPGSSYVFSQKQTFNGGITVDGDLGINVGTIHLTQSALQELNTQAQKIPTIESNVSDLTTSIDNITNDYMTLSTNQTVAGQKTFTQSQTFQAGLGVNGNAGINFNDVNLNMIDVVALLNIKDNFVNLKNSNEVPQDLYIGSFFMDGDDLSLIREVGGDGSDKNNIEIVTAGTVFGVGFSNANALINSFYLKDTQHNMLVEMGVDANTFYCSFLDGIFGFNFDKTTGEYFELILNGNVLFKNITYTYTNSEENIANNAYKTIQLTSLKDKNIAITSVAVTDGREPGILDGVIVSQPCWNGINWQVTLYNVSGSSITEIQLDITYHNLIK